MSRILMVTGSRGFHGNDYARNTIETALFAGHNYDPFTTVFNGMAKGLDTMVRDWVIAYNSALNPSSNKIQLADFPVTSEDWNTYGRGAGHRRNAIMLKSAIELSQKQGIPLMVAGFFYIKPSNGTQGTIDKSIKAGVKTSVITIDGWGNVTDFVIYPQRPIDPSNQQQFLF